MELNCVICGGSANEQSKKIQQSLTAQELKSGFTLFCKLLIRDSNDSEESKNGKIKEAGIENDELLSLITGEEENNFGNGDKTPPPPPTFCENCCKSLEEVIRLEKFIQDIKLSQLVHVKTLKTALISSKPADHGVLNTFWVQVTTQLINKCFPNPSLVSISQVKRTVKRHKVNTSPSKSSSSSTSNHSSQLPTATSHSSPPCRQSKLKAFQNLRKFSITQPYSEEDDDHDDQQSRSPPSADENEDNDHTFIPVKDEPQDITEDDEDYDPHNDLEDHFPHSHQNEPSTAAAHSEDDDTSNLQKSRSKPLTTIQNRYRHHVYLISPSDHLYIFKNIFLKYIPSSRHFLCQVPSCPHPILPQTFTSSPISSLQTHVTSHHTPFPSSSPTLRVCPKCTKSFPCNSFKSERLFTAHLHSCYANKHKILLCPICSKPCLYVDQLMHLWSHKNTQDKISSIQSGSPIPPQWKRRILSRKPESRTKDPFYSLITTGTVSTPEKQLVKVKAPLKKFRLNTPESLAQRTCPTCHKVFRYLEHLRKHKLTHLPEEDRQMFECPQCSKKLMSQKTLRNHMERVHRGLNQDGGGGGEGDVMIQCSQCPQQFYHRDTTFFKAHMKMHEGGDLPFICDKCGKGFWWKRYLDKHKDSHKDNNDRIQCDKCPKTFKQKRHLVIHRKRAH